MARAFTPLLLFIFWTPTTAPDLREPAFMSRADEGFQQIFNLDYDLAIQTFSAMREGYPDHPAPPAYLAVSVWLRELFARRDLDLDKFISPSYFDEPVERRMPAKERETFDENVRLSQRLCLEILKAHPQHKDARYLLGMTYGVLASFAITIDHDKGEAFSQGKKAYRYHHELVQEDPNYYDAYMSVGTYEYIVDNLPWYIKWLAVIVGYRGSEEQGFEYLRLAAAKGEYAGDEADTLLMVLQVREKRYEEALQKARHLHQKFPRSFLLHLNIAQILELMERREEAAAEYQTILLRAENETPNYSKIDLSTFRFSVGDKLMELHQWSDALEQFQESIAHAHTPPRERALSHLRAGQLLDLKGERQEALRHYRLVLGLQNFEDSHKHARKWIREPFQR